MKLYKISQTVNNDYDTYDSAIVCARNEEEARKTSPDDFRIFENGSWYFVMSNGTKEKDEHFNSWCDNIEDVKVEYIGEASDDLMLGKVLSSFNAG